MASVVIQDEFLTIVHEWTSVCSYMDMFLCGRMHHQTTFLKANLSRCSFPPSGITLRELHAMYSSPMINLALSKPAHVLVCYAMRLGRGVHVYRMVLGSACLKNETLYTEKSKNSCRLSDTTCMCVLIPTNAFSRTCKQRLLREKLVKKNDPSRCT